MHFGILAALIPPLRGWNHQVVTFCNFFLADFLYVKGQRDITGLVRGIEQTVLAKMP